MEMDKAKVPGHKRGKPQSLRLRLLLWYGTLLAATLGFFVLLILTLTTDAIDQSIEGEINAAARVATLDVRDDLSPYPPYWPRQLSMNVVDTYRDPGFVVEVLDAQGHLRYLSSSSTNEGLPLSIQTNRAALAGQTICYTTSVGGQNVRVEALPITAPLGNVSRSAVNATTCKASAGGTSPSAGPVVGVLLVAKSLDDEDDTVTVLRTLLLFAGLVTLGGTLVGIWAISTRVLHPLTEITSTAHAIAVFTARGTRLVKLS